MKKDQNLPNKTFIAIVVQVSPFQITPTTLDNNHPIIQFIEDDHHTKEFHKISHKTYIVDQIVEKINIKIIIQDQIQINTDLTTNPIQILEIEIIQIIDLETPHTIGIEIILTIGTLNRLEIILTIKQSKH